MLQIRDVMTRDVCTVTPQTTLRDTAELFAHRHVSGAPVVLGEKVVGVVSATDVLEFIAALRLRPAALGAMTVASGPPGHTANRERRELPETCSNPIRRSSEEDVPMWSP